jgi:hypothetical protein
VIKDAVMCAVIFFFFVGLGIIGLGYLGLQSNDPHLNQSISYLFIIIGALLSLGCAWLAKSIWEDPSGSGVKRKGN